MIWLYRLTRGNASKEKLVNIAMASRLEILARQLKQEVVGASGMSAQAKKIVKNRQRCWKSWRRNKRLVVAQCVVASEGLNALSLSVLKRLLSREIVESGNAIDNDGAEALVSSAVFNTSLRDHVASLMQNHPAAPACKEAARLLAEARTLVRVSQQTSRGLSLSPEQVSGIMQDEIAQVTTAHSASSPSVASANIRKKWLRQLRSRWGLHYGTLLQRAAVAPDVQRDRVRA